MLNGRYLIISSCFLLSPVAFADVSPQHTFDIQSGILHLLFEPSHLTTTLLIVFLLTILLRYKVLKVTEWILKTMYKN